ncbi:MAG: formylglycine-generating enzyme family protein [Paludibacteraceae bacterium]|nr:formylglycine-generating enzyme family protein [Paludibacteraceae bacterium]
MHKIAVCVFFMWCVVATFAQEVTNVIAQQVGFKVEILYVLDQEAAISVWLSKDGGKTYTYQLKALSGDVGNKVSPGKNKIIWDLECESLLEDILEARFRIDAQQAHHQFIVNDVSFTMISVTGGSFIMGATSEQGQDAGEEEKPKHKVTLSDYYIGQTEVTQALWKAVMGTSVRQQRNLENPSFLICGEGNDFPMYYVSMYECQLFIEKLNKLLSKKLNGMHFALPTEAQWEYAARGGIKTQNFKYSGSNSVDSVAWSNKNSNSSTHRVGTKKPNELGIYDMSGNVWEWCQDWYGAYKSFTQTNPTGPSSGSGYVYRGGCWYNGAQSCRTTCRVQDPGRRYNRIGFRLVLE